MISAGLGRYGPFVLHDGTYANLDSVEEVFTIGLNRAVDRARREAVEGPGGRNGGDAGGAQGARRPSRRRRHDRRARRPLRTLRQYRARSTPRCPRARTRQTVTLERGAGADRREGSQGGGGKKPFRKAAAAKAPGSEESSAAKKPAAKKKGRTAWRARITGRSHGDPTQPPIARAKVKARLPGPPATKSSRYIAENPDRAGKRDIAKALRLQGDDRICAQGHAAATCRTKACSPRTRKRLARAGALPHVAVLDIFGRDADGEPAGHAGRSRTAPARTARRSSIRVSRSGNGPAPGIGDRVLAKTFPTDEAAGPPIPAGSMKIFEQAHRCRARRLPRAAGRHFPHRAGRTARSRS